MTSGQAVVHDGAVTAEPAVRKIGFADLRTALERGIADFRAKPSHLVFLGLIYPIIAFIAGRFALGGDLMPLFYPMLAGIGLLGPFAAIGLYEISRRREQGLDVSWRHAFGVATSRSRGAIAVVAGLLAAVFLVWLATAQVLYSVLVGGQMPATFGAFLGHLLTTPEGWALIIVGNAAGLLFSIIAITLTVVSFPLLLDRQTGAFTAVHTSVRAVLANPKVMAVWGLIVGVGLVVGSLPLFVGLAVVVPIFGHATWHLYRLTVDPEGN